MTRKRILKTIGILVIISGITLSTYGPLAQPAAAPGGAGESAAAAKVDFTKDIKPIFDAKCSGCHNAGTHMSGYRMDTRDAAVAGGATGKAIIPGKAAESALYQRVAGIGEAVKMPFGGDPLPAKDIELIRAWIDEGAEWAQEAAAKPAEVKKHWAFIAPVRASLPPVKDKAWGRNAIDQFILARLEKESLKPSAPADRATLLRRLSLDLVGLPPTPGEIDAFIADASPNAYQKQVERLLASPHYGEKWGRMWLDAARYADSDGFEKDKTRSVWFYRDWVINSLNRDLPYNEFIIDQLAGDLLPNATQEQKVATGYLRNSMVNEEGGIDPEQFRMEAMFDRMDAIGKGMLGITIQCAQCHNHKYDPLTQEEYYKIFAFLNSCHEANPAVYTAQEEIRRAEIFRKTREVEAELQHTNSDWQNQMAKWEEEAKQGLPEWTVVKPEIDNISTGGQKYVPMPDGSYLASGYAPTKHRVKFIIKTDAPVVAAFQLELLTDPNLPRGGPGRSYKGTAALTEFEVEAAPADAPDNLEKIKVARATADVNSGEAPLEPIFDDKSGKKRVIGPIEYAIDGKDETAWGTDVGPGLRNQPRKAVFTLENPIANPKGSVIIVWLVQNHGGWNSDDNQTHNLGRLRLSMTSAPNVVADPVPMKVREILSRPRGERTTAETAAVFSTWRTTVPEWKEANARIADLWKQYPEGATQLVLVQREMPRATHILARGDFLKPGREVTGGTPAFLQPMVRDASWQNDQPTRLTFARWLVDRKSPTTARSIVNRVWQAYFGTGIVATSENFGTQCEPPSHPELLDWLAVEFMDHGWSLKNLHRLIANSASYRQASHVTPELLEKDPYNRLLARGPRFRVEAETVRDITLSASGLLNGRVGGPSVFPPAPEFLFTPPASYSPKPWPESQGTDRYRRGIYTFRFRSVPYPMMQAFDAPNGDQSCVRRARSNTPLQALTTLNEPIFMETARALASKALTEGGPTDRQRLNYAFRRCLGRKPTAAEASELLAFLEKQTKRYDEGQISPWKMTETSPALASLLPQGVTPARLASWTALSRVLLNLDETITKE